MEELCGGGGVVWWSDAPHHSSAPHTFLVESPLVLPDFLGFREPFMIFLDFFCDYGFIDVKFFFAISVFLTSYFLVISFFFGFHEFFSVTCFFCVADIFDDSGLRNYLLLFIIIYY